MGRTPQPVARFHLPQLAAPREIANTPAVDRRTVDAPEQHAGPDFNPLLELIFEDGSTNVHAGEREMRPPGAPTGSGH
jgi:hypothetical protein